MTATTHLPSGTANAVSRERAAANHPQTLHQTANPPPATFPGPIDAPSRRRVGRIAVRFAPRPPHTGRKSGSAVHRSRKSLTLSSKIKAQPVRFPRP